MFANSQWQIIFPESNQAVRFLFPVFINAEINFSRFTIDIPGHLAGRIESFGVSKIVYQLGKFLRHLVCVFSGHMLVFQPPVAVLFYEKGFSQFVYLSCKILFFK